MKQISNVAKVTTDLTMATESFTKPAAGRFLKN